MLDKTHNSNEKIRNLSNSLIRGNKTGDSPQTMYMEEKLQQLYDKYAQRIARITDESKARIRYAADDMLNKYDEYSNRLVQHKQDINDLITSYHEHHKAQRESI
mgnify:CR=1 FL=1